MSTPLTAFEDRELYNRYSAEQGRLAQQSEASLKKALPTVWALAFQWARLDRRQSVLGLQLSILESKQKNLKTLDEPALRASYVKELAALEQQFIEAYRLLLSGQLPGFAKNIPPAELPLLTAAEQKARLEAFIATELPQEMAEYAAFPFFTHPYLSYALETLGTQLIVTAREQSQSDKEQEQALGPWLQAKTQQGEHQQAYERACEAQQQSLPALAGQGALQEVRKRVEAHPKKEDRVLYLNQSSPEGTALQLACQHKQLPVVDYLLQAGASPSQWTESSGYTALQLGLITEGPETLELLECFQKHKAPLTLLSRGGETALHTAAKHNNLQAARWLIQNAAPLLNQVSTRNQETPLHLATLKGHALMVRFLLSQQAEYLNNSKGVSPLLIAVSQNDKASAQAFVEEGFWLSHAEQTQLKHLMRTNPAGSQACSRLLDALLKEEIQGLDPSATAALPEDRKLDAEAASLERKTQAEQKALAEALTAPSVLRNRLEITPPSSTPEQWLDAFLSRNAEKAQHSVEPWSVLAKNQALDKTALAFQERESKEAEEQEAQLLSSLASSGKLSQENELNTRTFTNSLLAKHQALKSIRQPFIKKITASEAEKLDLFRALFDTKLSDLYLKCLSITKGLSDLPKDKTQRMIQLIGFTGRFIPIPYASLLVSGISEAAQYLLTRRGKQQLKSFLSDSPVLDLHSASQVVHTIVEVFTHRHQHQIKALAPPSIELLVEGLLHRMFLYKRNPDKDYFAHLSLSLKEEPDLREALHLARGSSQSYASMLQGPAIEGSHRFINQFTHNPLLEISKKIVSVEALCRETRILTENEQGQIVFCYHPVRPEFRDLPPLCVQPIEASLRRLRPLPYEAWLTPQFQLHRKVQEAPLSLHFTPLSAEDSARLTRTQSLPAGK